MSPPTKGPGLLLRLYSPRSPSSEVSKALDVPGAAMQKITATSSTDDKVATGYPSRNMIYHVLHISRFLLEGAYEKDLALTDGNATALQWHVYKLMYRRSRAGLEGAVHPKGCTVVCVGVTPQEGASEDYAEWFDDEHVNLLSLVPGWRQSARYELARAIGTRDFVAPYLAVHVYDEVNGLVVQSGKGAPKRSGPCRFVAVVRGLIFDVSGG